MGNPLTRMLSRSSDLSRRLSSTARDVDEAEAVEALCSAVARFCAERVDVDRIERERTIGKDVLAGLAELGLFGLTVPEEHGGGGLSMQGACRVVTELAKVDGSLATAVALHLGLALRGLVALGSEALHEALLPDVATGRKIACFAATEPEAGSDISAVRTRAVPKGDVLVLDGSKIFVTNGGIASFATVLAATPGLGGMQRGHSVLLVDLDSPGVRRGREEHKLGLKGSSTITIDFDGVEVPAANLLGEPGRGLDCLQEALSWGRTFLSAGCVGTAQGALAVTRTHTATRKQFARTLDGFEMVREHLADMAAATYTMESLLRLTTRIEDDGFGNIGWESSIAKLFCSETAWTVTDTALQLHGGSGYIEETGIARRLRDCRVTRIFEGANDVLRLHIASGALTWRRADLSELPRLLPEAHADLAETAAAFDEGLRQVVDAVLRVRKRYGTRVFERQLVQGALADALVATFGLAATLLRTQDSLCSDRPSASDDLARCRHAARPALTNARHALERVETEL